MLDSMQFNAKNLLGNLILGRMQVNVTDYNIQPRWHDTTYSHILPRQSLRPPPLYELAEPLLGVGRFDDSVFGFRELVLRWGGMYLPKHIKQHIITIVTNSTLPLNILEYETKEKCYNSNCVISNFIVLDTSVFTQINASIKT
jgi:hypothetical protein